VGFLALALVSLIICVSISAQVDDQSLVGEWSTCEESIEGFAMYASKFKASDERLDVFIVGKGKNCKDIKTSASLALVSKWSYSRSGDVIHQTLISEHIYFFDKTLAKRYDAEKFCNVSKWLAAGAGPCVVEADAVNNGQRIVSDSLQKRVWVDFRGSSISLSDTHFGPLFKSSYFRAF
jgi:hypothetical protein